MILQENLAYFCSHWNRGVKHTARGPKPARCLVESSPRDDFVKQKLLCLLEVYSAALQQLVTRLQLLETLTQWPIFY